jgi:hypothetical protein
MTDIKQIKDYFKNDRIGDAIQSLIDVCNTHSERKIQKIRNSALLLQSRYKGIVNKNNKGILSHSDFQLEVNKVRTSLLDLINEFELSLTENQNHTKEKVLPQRKTILLSIVGIVILMSAFAFFKTKNSYENNPPLNSQSNEPEIIDQSNSDNKLKFEPPSSRGDDEKEISAKSDSKDEPKRVEKRVILKPLEFDNIRLDSIWSWEQRTLDGIKKDYEEDDWWRFGHLMPPSWFFSSDNYFFSRECKDYGNKECLSFNPTMDITLVNPNPKPIIIYSIGIRILNAMNMGAPKGGDDVFAQSIKVVEDYTIDIPIPEEYAFFNLKDGKILDSVFVPRYKFIEAAKLLHSGDYMFQEKINIDGKYWMDYSGIGNLPIDYHLNLDDPIRINAESPFRFKLTLKNYSRLPNNVQLRAYVRTSNETSFSKKIHLSNALGPYYFSLILFDL